MAALRKKTRTARKPARSAEFARLCARLADDKKGEDIIILDLRKLTYVTDFFIIVTVGNLRQMDAIASSISHELAQRGERRLGSEGTKESRWVLLDYGDFVVHLFDHEWRRLYDLELLWGDVPRIEWQE